MHRPINRTVQMNQQQQQQQQQQRRPVTNSNTNLARTTVRAGPTNRPPQYGTMRTGSYARGSSGPIDNTIYHTVDNTLLDNSTISPNNPVILTTADNNQGIENEYIVNLQQQVYLLELELNLLKKSSATGTNNSSGARGSSDNSDPDAPLDNVILSLREKYILMETDYKRQLAELQAKLNELSKSNHLQLLTIESVNMKYQQLSAENDHNSRQNIENQKYIIDLKLSAEQSMKLLTDKLKSKELELIELSNELLAIKTELLLSNQHNEQQSNEYLAQLKLHSDKTIFYDNKARIAEEQLIELKQKLLQENPAQSAELLAELTALRTDIINIENKNKKYENHIVSIESNNNILNKTIETLTEENRILNQKLNSIANELKDRIDKEEFDRSARIYWSSHLIDLQKKNEEYQSENSNINKELSAIKLDNSNLKQELCSIRVVLDDADRKLNTAINQSKSMEIQCSELLTNNNTLGRDLSMREIDYQTYYNQCIQYKQLIEKLNSDKSELQYKLNDSEYELSLRKAFESINFSEVLTAANSNLKIAGAIESLMEKIQSKPNNVSNPTVKTFKDKYINITENSEYEDSSQSINTNIDNNNSNSNSRPITAAVNDGPYSVGFNPAIVANSINPNNNIGYTAEQEYKMQQAQLHQQQHHQQQQHQQQQHQQYQPTMSINLNGQPTLSNSMRAPPTPDLSQGRSIPMPQHSQSSLPGTAESFKI